MRLCSEAGCVCVTRKNVCDAKECVCVKRKDVFVWQLWDGWEALFSISFAFLKAKNIFEMMGVGIDSYF